MYPSKEEIYKWYVEEDGAYKDAPDHFGISRWKFEDLCRVYGIKKDRHKTCLKSVKTRENKAGGKDKYNQQLKETWHQNAIKKYGSADKINELRSNSLRKTWATNHRDILDKVYETKSENNSFNVSQPEIAYYNYLVDKYGADDVKTQYADSRYPFKCDFYIKSKDLFIELNLHWSHGGHLFTGSTKDLKMLDHWKQKAERSKFYQNAIDTWTKRDTEKYNYFIKNKLNFKIIYYKEDMYE